MKTLAIILVSLSATFAAHAAGTRVEVTGQALQPLTRAQAAELQGRYVLSDGRTLEVARQGARLLAALDGRADATMLALSATRLQSADGALVLDFDAAPNGSVAAVRLSQRPDSR